MKGSKALGRGLSSLLREEVFPIEASEDKTHINIELIYANPDQPRAYFDNEHIQELADSISAHGVLQPIIVNKDDNEKYKIIAGERRYRAAKIVGLTEIPVIIKEYSDREIFEVALIENIQRDELTCIEEARGYQKLMKDYGYTQNDVANSVGKSRSHIANLVRLNRLPEEVQDMLAKEKLTMGHARCLIDHPDALQIAEKIISEELSVRKTEELVSGKNASGKPKKKQKSSKTNTAGGPIYQENSEDLIMLGESLSEKLGVKVTVENSGNGGKISIHYSTLEELDFILTTLD